MQALDLGVETHRFHADLAVPLTLHARAMLPATVRLDLDPPTPDQVGLDLRAAAELGCATAAQVAQGLGTDAGAYDLDAVRAFAATAPAR